MMLPDAPSRDEIASRYLEQLPFEPYPVQEEALLAWFTSRQGVLVCAPTGTGKTLIAEAGLFEALHTGQIGYYTTPLIALTEQKFRELQSAAVKWGFSPDDVGLVTGNRRVNPQARVLVVVAEILLNRLLHREAFDFADVGVVVMDEFHNFNDRERGIVWEFALGLLPPHVRTLLLSATVGNAQEFVNWLDVRHGRKLDLVQSTERRVPLSFHWIGDEFLSEMLETLADGDDESRKTPALVFCFNREQCWSVAENLKGKSLLRSGQQAELVRAMERFDWSQGAGPKLKQILMRGVGVHHAGLLPKYRRLVEDLFQQKLLSVCVCTETLAAGINLPARSVVVPELLKGKPGEKKLIEPSSAHQMFGRAGRPQFDTHGHVFALAHEDDVKIERWREKYDSIPEDTKDFGLLKAKKALKKKMPHRRSNEQYWTMGQFVKLTEAPPGKLYSHGAVPWRMLGYMLSASPEVELLRNLVSKRLMDPQRLAAGQKQLDNMLMTLWRAGYVDLEPPPPKGEEREEREDGEIVAATGETAAPAKLTGLAKLLADAHEEAMAKTHGKTNRAALAEENAKRLGKASDDERPGYRPEFAYPTPELDKLVKLRGINPLYGVFLVNQLGIADRAERIQALESVLELPSSVGHFVRVPHREQLPPGPLATTRLDAMLLQLGIASAADLGASESEAEPPPEGDSFLGEDGERKWVLRLADKLRLLFEHDFPDADEVEARAVWAAGEVLEFGDFNKYVTSKGLQKQEGIIFRHLLRFILLAKELAQLCPPDTSEEEWRGDLLDIAGQLTEVCRKVDPSSTDEALERAQDDVLV
jgi:superfamily II DNA/RNA helicase